MAQKRLRTADIEDFEDCEFNSAISASPGVILKVIFKGKWVNFVNFSHFFCLCNKQ